MRIKLLFISIFYIILKVYYVMYNKQFDILVDIYNYIIMGVTTSLHIVSTGKASLKTTVPVFIVKQFNLKKGDNLEWCIDMHNNEMVIIVKKIK